MRETVRAGKAAGAGTEALMAWAERMPLVGTWEACAVWPQVVAEGGQAWIERVLELGQLGVEVARTR